MDTTPSIKRHQTSQNQRRLNVHATDYPDQKLLPPSIKFTPEQTFVVGETLNIQWKAEAEFLAEPYKGSDAYETHDGLMAAMVSTFKGADLKVKK
jgi:hypothetical protein